MNPEAGILAVGEELPPLDSSPEVPCQPAVRGPRRRRPKPSTGQAPGRFQTLNAFVDGTLRGLSRSEMAAWLVLYRDTREGIARTSLADMARRGLLPELAEAGVTFHWFNGMVHGKAMVVDSSVAYVGSPNLDMRSFFLNYEDALMLYSSAEIAAVRAWIERLTAECPKALGPPVRRWWLFDDVARLLAPEL